jgi:Nif-specific regulatory protein
MTSRQSTRSKRPSEDVAYLVVKQGGKPCDVFRLVPGKVVTVGRAPTNRVVVWDDVCSRNHCEIFQSDSAWTLRDLGSRNGTRINGERVAGDRELTEGELIQIGECELGFTFDPSRSLSTFAQEDRVNSDAETTVDLVYEQPSDSEHAIILRTRNSRYQSPSPAEMAGSDRISQELARLYQLALDMGAASNAKNLSKVVLDGLFAATSADIGAVLLLPEAITGEAEPSELRVIAYKGTVDVPYQKVSDFLSRTVLADREAILARDLSDDSRLIDRDSLGEIHARSVICAPIRVGLSIHGLIHLYSTNPEIPLDADDLEFTLAVADQMAVILDSLKQKESLASGLARVKDENQTLRRQLEIDSELVGDSPVMNRLRDQIAKIAPTEATVLIRGESGVGKELVARAIYFSSQRRKEPFVCMNCAALTESLLESELFGHEKGAFTGATDRKSGKFEQAHGGTLFLDEVGEMSSAIQAKFLRALEGHPFERVGGDTPIQVDVRVLAATNRDLERSVEEGSFRADLYFRLHVVEIKVESLREHRADIPILALHFLKRLAAKSNRPVERFTPAGLEALMTYEWPGNIRELQNAIERAVILCPGREITDADIQLSTLGASPAHREVQSNGSDYRELSLDLLEQEHILATLKRTKWNKSQAAQILGIERSTLDRKLKRYRISRPQT